MDIKASYLLYISEYTIFLAKSYCPDRCGNYNLLPLHPILQVDCMHFPEGITTYLLRNQYNVKPAFPESHI